VTTLTPMSYDLVDLEPGDARLVAEVLPVLRELRPHLTPETLAAVYEEGHPQGLRFLAAYDGDRCVGVAGWRVVACSRLSLDSGVTRHDAHRFYLRERMVIASHHFAKKL
jgi:hypothetical protein